MNMKLRGISKEINGKQILTNVNLDIPDSKIIGLVGRNGSGKTTLMKIMSSEMLATIGRLEVEKTDVFYIDPLENFMKYYSPKTISQVLKSFLEKFDEDLFFDILSDSNLPMDKSISNFSKGQQALLYIAAGLASKVKYILLDEPLDGLDVFVKDKVRELLIDNVGKDGTTIIVATHNLSELDSLADSIILLKDDKVEMYDVDDSDNVKVQFVYDEDELPVRLRPVIKVVEKRGKVWLVIMPDDEVPKLLAEPDKFEFVEVLPITTEDIFRTELMQGDII